MLNPVALATGVFNMKNKSSITFWVKKIHLWLGMLSGLIVFVVAITGAIYTFQDEIKDVLFSYRKVAVQHQPFLPPSQLYAIAKKVYPEGSIARIVSFNEGRSSWVLVKSGKDYFYVYLNPYTGTVLHKENLRSDFFMIVQFTHMYLLLPKEIGKPIVGYAVLVFVVMIITGLILWWPRRKAHRRQRFAIKWNGRWRRVNYDLHNVLGFYVFSIALILAVTGLSMSFTWVKESLYTAANMGKQYVTEKKEDIVSDTVTVKKYSLTESIDFTYKKVKQHSPKAQMILVNVPAKKEGTITITAYKKQLHYYHRDNYYFDQYTTSLLTSMPHSAKSAGLKLNDMNYDLHTGQILGFFGKIIAFLSSLIIASMPVTGFLIWWGRRYK